MNRAARPGGLTQRGSAPLDFPPSPVAGAAGKSFQQPPQIGFGIALRQGSASPSSSPGPASRAAASGDALDAFIGRALKLSCLKFGAVMKRKNISDFSGISNAEKRRRQVAVDYARASISLEGFTLGTDQEGRARAFVDGELTLAEFVSVSDSQIPFVR